MNLECGRIADQLNRAFAGDAWHGPSLRELLSGVTAVQAHSRPLAYAHSIRELVLHIDLYVHATLEAIQGTPMPPWYSTGTDWLPVTGDNETEWMKAVDRLFLNADRLRGAIEALTDDQLKETVPGREYDFYYLFHGLIQHSLYHGGQIAILRKA